ncbi:MAG: ABC transporter ATP-binding protein [Actinomycetota bacterium]
MTVTPTPTEREAAIDEEDDDVPADDAPDPGGLGELLRPIRGKLVLACALQAASAVVGLVPFVAIAELARELLGDDPDDGRLWSIAAVAAAALVARLALMLGAASVTHFADNDLQLDVRRRLADRLGRVPLGWYDDRDAGEVKKAVVDDVGSMHHLVGHSFTDLTTAIVTPIAAMVLLFVTDWQLSLVVMVPFLLGVALYARQMSGYGDKMTRYDEALEEVNTGAVEFVQGISVVKTFGQAGRAHRRFLDAAYRLVDYFWDWVSSLLRAAAASEVVLSPLATLALISGAGTWFVSTGRIDAVDLVLFFVLGLALTAPILTLGYAATDLQIASQAAARVSQLLHAPVLPTTDTPQLPDGNHIAFDRVSFSYDGERDVLRDVDLRLDTGTVTALVGPSGSGKTTLAKLLCRFWDPTEGAVRLGGVDLREIAPDELYRHVGFVFQDVQLLRATVADNVRLGRPDADDAAVEGAARSAQIHDRITALPRGYDSVVGEDAVLSGGEAQRISIARALLADAPVLVLDEATAFADPESEAAIQDALSVLAGGRTLLVIAHRLSTIVGADQIAVVDDGRIVERGRHDELLVEAGLYRRLWDADRRITIEPTGRTS